MNRTLLLLSLFLCAAIAGCAPMEARPDGTAGKESGAEQKILVMLHMPAPHFRPDSDYAGAYGDQSARSARQRIAADIARLHGLTVKDDWPMPALGIHCFVMEDPGSAASEGVAERISHDPRVEWAQPLNRYHAMAQGDPLYPLQPGARLWRLAEIHQVATGRDVHVAIIDSGIETRHPDLIGQVDLAQNFVAGKPYVAENHGTAVAGIIAARADNGLGIRGVAPAARLLALRACWEQPGADTECNSFTLGKALHFALSQRVQVINLSVTGPADRLLGELLDQALARGIKVVAASDSHDQHGGFPASHPGVLAVSDEASAARAGAAAHGFAAPGQDIPTTMPGARWNFVSGASFAAAHVSGLVALISELRPGLSAAAVQKALVAAPARPGGDGIIDACATFLRLAGNCSCACGQTNATALASPFASH